MATYSISAPDGKTYEITGPDGASQEQVQAEVLKQHPSAGTPKQAAQQGEDASSQAQPSSTDRLKHLAASLYGNLEAIPAMASGIGAQSVAGLAGLATGGNADVVNKVQNALTYQPRTDMGQATMSAIGSTLGLIPKGADYVGGKVADATGSPALGAAANTALQAIPMALGAKYGPKSAGASSTLNETAAQSLKDAGDMGLVVTPTDAGMSGTSPIAKAAESSGSMTKLQQAATKVNANRITDAVKQDIGVPPEQQLTPDVLKQRNADADAMYQVVRNADKNQIPVKSTNGMQLTGPDGSPLTKPAGPLQLGEDYQAAVKNIGADRANPDFASKIDPEVQALKDELSGKTQLSTGGTVSKITDLRQEARGNLSRVGATSQEKNLGRAQMQAADVLESQLSKYLQADQPGIAQTLAQARTLKAKLGTLNDAFDKGSGNIDASVIHRDLENGVPLSGNLEKIGRVYGQFSKVMGDPTKIATGSHSIVDAGLMSQGVIRAMHGDASGLAEAGLGAARPLARKLAMSDSYQNMLRSGKTAPGILSGLGAPAGAASPFAALQTNNQQAP